MALSDEWTEYHLTPRGWERGSERDDDGSGVKIRKRPPDAVQTWRWTDAAQFDGRDEIEFERGGDISWSSDDAARIAELRAEHGDPPNHL